MTTGKDSFFTSLSLSLLICKLGIGLPWWLSAKESACQFRSCKRRGFHPWIRKIPWRRKMAIHSSILAWEIAWTEEPSRLQSMESLKSCHDLTPNPQQQPRCVRAQSLSQVQLLAHEPEPARLFCPWNSPRQEYWGGCHFLFQGIFLTQGSYPCLLHLLNWQKVSISLCHLGNPQTGDNSTHFQSYCGV